MWQGYHWKQKIKKGTPHKGLRKILNSLIQALENMQPT